MSGVSADSCRAVDVIAMLLSCRSTHIDYIALVRHSIFDAYDPAYTLHAKHAKLEKRNYP